MNQLFLSKKSINSTLFFLLLLLGAFLRFVFLDTVPGGLHQDESFVALNAFDMFHEGTDSAGLSYPIYMSDWGDGHSAMYVWLLTPLLTLTNGHMNALICRIPQALIGTLTLAAVYFLMKELFDRTMGFISLFLLAICPWHIMMCRWGLDANIAPGFLIFSLLFFVKGLHKPKFLLLSAIFHGLSLYCYAVIWPVVPCMLLLEIVYGICHKKLSFNRYSVFSILLLFVLALPLLLFVLINMTSLPAISLPFMTIPKAHNFRGGEVAFHFSSLIYI